MQRGVFGTSKVPSVYYPVQLHRIRDTSYGPPITDEIAAF